MKRGTFSIVLNEETVDDSMLNRTVLSKKHKNLECPIELLVILGEVTLHIEVVDGECQREFESMAVSVKKSTGTDWYIFPSSAAENGVFETFREDINEAYVD
jgi:hypothetical protein